MLRACLDTNVWISGLVFSGPPAQIIDLAVRKSFQLILSTFILGELEKNLIKKFSVEFKAAQALRHQLSELAVVYQPAGNVDAVKENQADNLILETALLGQADYLVTGDRKHLLPLGRFRGVTIIEPSKFLDILRATPR